MQGTIAVISPSSTLTSVMHGILEQRGLALVVIEAAQHDAVLKARQLIDTGVSVIISRGRTASVLREHLRVPIVEVKHTFFDCINAYRKAQQDSGKVAFLATSEGYATILEKARPFMPQVSICLIDPLGSHQATEAQLDRLQAEGIEVAIGGLSSREAVMARGMRYIMSEADPDAASMPSTRPCTCCRWRKSGGSSA